MRTNGIARICAGTVGLLFSLGAAFAQLSPAEQLIQAGHWKKARSLAETRIRTSPDDALAHYLLSQIRNAFGEHKTPLPLAEKAVALDRQTAKYHRQLAEVLGVSAQHAGIFQQLLLARRFRKEIDTAIELDSRDLQAQRDLLEFYLLAPGIAGGDPRKAETTAARIAEIDLPEGFLAKARIADSLKRTGEQEAYLRQAAEAKPPNYRARIALARFYLEPAYTNPAAAEAAARQALEIHDDRVEAYTVLAEIYAIRAEWNTLETVLNQSTRHVPDDLTPYYRAAERLLAAGREPERAERYLRSYLSQEAEGNAPPAAQAHWKLGLALEIEGNRSAAVGEWQESVRLDPASPAGLDLKRRRTGSSHAQTHSG